MRIYLLAIMHVHIVCTLCMFILCAPHGHMPRLQAQQSHIAPRSAGQVILAMVYVVPRIDAAGLSQQEKLYRMGLAEKWTYIQCDTHFKFYGYNIYTCALMGPEVTKAQMKTQFGLHVSNKNHQCPECCAQQNPAPKGKAYHKMWTRQVPPKPMCWDGKTTRSFDAVFSLEVGVEESSTAADIDTDDDMVDNETKFQQILTQLGILNQQVITLTQQVTDIMTTQSKMNRKMKRRNVISMSDDEIVLGMTQVEHGYCSVERSSGPTPPPPGLL